MSKKTCSKSQLRNAKGGRAALVTSTKGNFYKPYAVAENGMILTRRKGAKKKPISRVTALS